MKKNILCSADERAYPVLVCDENLFIVDLNDAACEKGLSNHLFENMSKHLSLRDTTTVRAFLRRVRCGAKCAGCVEVEVNGLKGGKIALVVIRSYFDKYFFEFSLFRSNAAILSESNPLRFMLPGDEYPGEYFLGRGLSGIESTALKLNRLFASGVLSKLYMKASDPKRRFIRFDAAQVLREMITGVNGPFEFTDSKFAFSFRGKETFFVNNIDMSDYINILALMIKLVGELSASGNVSVSCDCNGNVMKIYFDTELKEPVVEMVGDFCFMLIGEAYPQYATYADVIKYMCEICGIGVYADIEGESSFTAEIDIGRCTSEDEILLHCPEQTDTKEYYENAVLFVSIIGGCNE